MADGLHDSGGTFGLVSAYDEISKPGDGADSASPLAVWVDGPRGQHESHSDSGCLSFWAPGRNHARVRTVLPGLFCAVGGHQDH